MIKARKKLKKLKKLKQIRKNNLVLTTSKADLIKINNELLSKKPLLIEGLKIDCDDAKGIFTLQITYNGKAISVIMDQFWNVNITWLAKAFDKNWQSWKKYHAAKIAFFEKFTGNPQIIAAYPGAKGATWISFELAVQVVNSGDDSFSLLLSHICKHYFLQAINRLAEFKKFQDNLQIRKKRFHFKKGPCIYCYTVNDLRKVGFSSDGNSRIKSHATSVGNLIFDGVFFMSNAAEVEKAIKLRFLFPKERPKNNREHYSATAKEIKKFIVEYAAVMNFDYRELTPEELKFFADGL